MGTKNSFVIGVIRQWVVSNTKENFAKRPKAVPYHHELRMPIFNSFHYYSTMQILRIGLSLSHLLWHHHHCDWDHLEK
jgi:hypothetical protein